jgi:hypothetical protein
MLLELARPLSFLLSILSLCPVMFNAFFVPGTRWEERLEMALLRVVVAACVCFASGLLYAWPSHGAPEPPEPLLSTLPVRLFLWALAGMVVLFALSWYLDTYFVPVARRDCCRL